MITDSLTLRLSVLAMVLAGVIFWIVLTNRGLALFAIWVTALLLLRRKHDESELVELNARLARSNKELEDFASAASHDLQEPLRKIQAIGGRLGTKYADQLDEQGAERIFGIFQRLHKRGSFEGVGLGLPLAQRLIEAHGGELSIDSAPGAGTTLSIRLPKERLDGG